MTDEFVFIFWIGEIQYLNRLEILIVTRFILSEGRETLPEVTALASVLISQRQFGMYPHSID